MMKEYCIKNALKQIATTPYHPQAMGHLEHLNGSLVQLIVKLFQKHPITAWTKHFPSAFLILQARVNFYTGFNPSTLAFGTPHGLNGVEGESYERIKEATFRIDNSFTLETWSQGWDSNPGPESLWAAGPMDCGAACLYFPDVKPLQAEAKNNGPNGKASQTKGISTPNGGVIKAPKEGNKIPTISFMRLKSILVAHLSHPQMEALTCSLTS
ncbi:hypothetical protein DSO57_1027607 [Entomophthora muscae]|uniref:Uncharacterized protein n=1 Tax=Entomophthora muscae TaxID=34485 RepID=A0ACC2RGE8_9FUNG|nr:hypothetical protein DSO57_1027607 [Entomophthora muscae]